MNEEKIKEILEENVKLKEELQAAKEHLKKYTAPAIRKEYYEKNKEVIKERSRKYKETTNYKSTPEQRKEYNKRAYLRKKEKIQKELEEKQNNENI
jgi:copper oxidase (laccase) domain-containing protein